MTRADRSADVVVGAAESGPGLPGGRRGVS